MKRSAFFLLLLFLGLALLFRESTPHTPKWIKLEGKDEFCAEESDEACAEGNEPHPDSPGEAFRFRRFQSQDESGRIPANGLMEAFQHVEKMRVAQGPQPRGAGIAAGEWTWLGPGNVGGRIRSILTHPTNPDRLWVGSVSGGIWTTEDRGASWYPVDDFMSNLAVATLAMQPDNPDVMYAGTGEGFYNFDGILGAGIFKSADGGLNWTQLSATATDDWYFVNRLSISPDGSTILAATGSGIWRSEDGGDFWVRSLYDGRVKDIDFHPYNNGKAIASGTHGMAWYSTNGGESWTAAAGLPSLDWLNRVEVAYAPSEPNIVYASVENNGGEVWKSLDGGKTYRLVMETGGGYTDGQGWYDNIIWVDPTNADVVVVGGSGWLRRSIDGGQNFVDISTFWSGIHPDHHAIVSATFFNGADNTTVYFGNDGGIAKADNIYTVSPESGWEVLNNNLGITQFYGASGNPDTGVIIGGTQDNGTPRSSGDTENWTFMSWGDGGWAAADPTDPDYFYSEHQGMYLYRSTDGGRTAHGISDGLDDAEKCANFIAPFILDPNNSNTLLAGGCRLWRSTSVKEEIPTWSVIKPALIDGSISAIAVAPGNSDIIWIGYNNGEVFKSVNGTAVNPDWQRVDSDRLYLPYRYITRLTIDPDNSDIVYITFSGFERDNVWRSDDGGQTWRDITGEGLSGLPDVTVRSLVVHPYNTDWLYVGTEVGIFASEDAGQTWFVPHDGPANVSIDELFWMDTTLVAATHGRGIFSIETYEKSTCYTLDLNTDPPNAGFIFTNPPPNCNDRTQYRSGTIVQLTAEPINSFFKNWSGDVDEPYRTTTIRMNRDKAVTAKMEAPDTPVAYIEDFEGGVGSEWSMPFTDTTPAGSRQFLGQFGNDTVSLDLDNLPPDMTAKITLDLYVLQSWDGNQDPDLWSLSANGTELFQTTFSNVDEYDSRQAYPDTYPDGDNPAYTGAVEVDSLGYWWYGDSIYRLSFDVPYSGPSLRLDFSASGLQSFEDESWGLDNVVVTLSDSEDSTPPTMDWIAPVSDYQSEEVYGETVLLKVDAVDNKGEVAVRFEWWHTYTQQRVLIGETTSWPYQVEFDTSHLFLGCQPVYAIATDSVGNLAEKYIILCLFQLNPPDLTIEPPSPNPGHFTLQWPEVSGATSYELQEKKGTGNWVQIYEGELTRFTRTNVSAGEYCYRARSIRAEIFSDWSSVSCVTVDPALDPPSIPEISAIENENKSPDFLVQWRPSTGADRYQLQERQGIGQWTLILEGSNTSYLALSKVNGLWCYRVRALSEGGASDWSTTVCTTVDIFVDELHLYLPTVLGDQ